MLCKKSVQEEDFLEGGSVQVFMRFRATLKHIKVSVCSTKCEWPLSKV